MTFRKINELRNWSDNPRSIKPERFQELKNRITRFGQFKPVIITPDGEVLGGNMRLKAMKELGIEDIWVSIVEPKTEAEKIEIALTDNEEMGFYEDKALIELISKYKQDIDLMKYEVNLDEMTKLHSLFEIDNELSDDYSQNLGEVIYEPKQTNHQISDLFTPETKFDKEIDKLQNEELKEMLKQRTSFFSEFNFSKIADYYAYQATPEEKVLFEKLGLVLLDKDKLLENGFTDLIASVFNED